MSQHAERILIILPALNEGASIARTVRNIRQHMPMADVVVINDGSTDDTAAQAATAGAIVLHMPYNVGIGASVQTGFQFARRYGYDIVVRNDGDGQHAAEDIPRMVEALCESGADMVIGSRFLGGGGRETTTFARRVGISILVNLIRLITGRRFTDPTSGFAAFNRRAAAFCAAHYPHDYPEPEAIVILHRAGFKLQEIPVTMRPRTEGVSSITPVRSAYYMLKVILAILINLLRPTPSVEE